MKTMGLLAITLSVLASVTSFGIYDPHWERPLQKASLTEIFDHEGFSFPVAQEITLHQRDGEKEATLFSLVEDTGIRCVKAPCPSIVTTLFEIVERREIDALTVEYTARELPRLGEFGNITSGLRTMRVVEFMGFQQQWNVHLEDRASHRRQFVGYPQGVATIESAPVGE